MEIWPSEPRSTNSSAVQKPTGRLRKSQQSLKDNANGPTLRTGTLGAATLVKQDDRLRWRFCLNDTADTKPPPKILSGPTRVFPETSLDPYPAPKVTANHRAEQGARFLRQHYPDVDLPMDLLRSNIIEDHILSQTPPPFDPVLGNCISGLSSERMDGKENMEFLAFSGGDIGEALYIAPLLSVGRGSRVLAPQARPAKEFSSSIHHVLVAPNLLGSRPLIAVRTLQDAHLATITLPLKPNDATTSGTTHLSIPDCIPWQRLGGKRMMDIAFNPFCELSQGSNRACMVDTTGRIWNWGIEEGKPLTVRVGLHAEDSDKPQLNRIAWGSTSDILYHVNYNIISTIDMRAPRSVSSGTPFLPTVDGIVTSVTSPVDGIFCVCTTKRLLWIDERNINKPALAWVHEREEDQSLSGRYFTPWGAKAPLTFLSSAKSCLMTVYDVNRGSTGTLVHSRGLPSAINLAGPSSVNQFNQRQGFYLHAHENNRGVFDLFELSSRRGVFQTRLRFGEGNEMVSEDDEISVHRTPGLEKLQNSITAMENSKTDLGPLRARESDIINFQDAYKVLFDVHERETKSNKNPQKGTGADTALEAIERFASFWQETDIPLEHMMTTQDIIMQSGPVPEGPIRADFLSGHSLSTPQSRSVLASRGAIPTEGLARDAALHFNIRETINILAPPDASVPEGLESLDGDVFKPYDVSHADWPDLAILRRESDAKTELAIDLALSLDVFSKEPFRPTTHPAGKVSDIDKAIVMMSQTTLSDDEPPPLTYGFFQPMKKSDSKGRNSARRGRESRRKQSSIASDEEDIEAPTGVRRLLAEWTVGDDPKAYVFSDPYGATKESPDPQPLTLPMDLSQRSTVPVIAASQPIRESSRPFKEQPPPWEGPTPGRTSKGGQKQRQLGSPAPDADGGQFWSSQLLVSERGNDMVNLPSTQPQPGPFGGRDHLAVKSKVKRRIGGF